MTIEGHAAAVIAPGIDGTTPQYQPVFDLGTGAMVGAHLLASSDAAPTGALLPLALHDLCQPVPTQRGWWVVVPLQPGELPLLALLLEQLAPQPASPRLLVEVADQDLAGLDPSSVTALADAGVRLVVAGFASQPSAAVVRGLPVSHGVVSLTGASAADPRHRAVLTRVARSAADLGISLVAADVERDEQLELVHAAGIGLVQGYRWGSPGPMGKLVLTWGRTR